MPQRVIISVRNPHHPIGGYLLWLLALILPLSLYASPPSAKDDEKGILVGFSQDTLANDWRLAQVHAVQKGLERYKHIRFIFTDGKGSTAKQILDIEDMISKGVDILITSPRDGRAMRPVIEQAFQQGIPVILLTRRIEGHSYTTFIAPDDAAIARESARFITRRLSGKGNVLVLQGLPSASTAIIRTTAFIEELAKSPGLRVIAMKSANYLRSDAIQAVEEVLQQGLSFDAIYAQSDSMASGARIALNRAGINPAEIAIVGIDYIPEAREAIRNGQQSASFTYPLCADEAVKAVLAITRGKSVPKSIQVPSQRVTVENVDRVEAIF